ncbi:hypothetical protein Aduo_004648 [Ancylostoma duodenale]
MDDVTVHFGWLSKELMIRESFTSTPLSVAALFSSSDSSQNACPAQQPTSCPTTKCYFYAAGYAVGTAALGYFIGYKMAKGKSGARMNTKVKVAKDLVVDMVDMEDIGEKKGFCRCWKSEKFPYCDGAHVKHNKETGDNVGPLVVKGKR